MARMKYVFIRAIRVIRGFHLYVLCRFGCGSAPPRCVSAVQLRKILQLCVDVLRASEVWSPAFRRLRCANSSRTRMPIRSAQGRRTG